MEKIKMQTPNLVDENIEKIGRLFPDCLTERTGADGKTEQAIDFDKLRQELSKSIVEGDEERYQFTWPGKKQAIITANAPINKTLRPCREESVDFDNTQNLYIEGDNLDVLKLLREDYLGKVKMIYIDPPYNTGNDFVYEDDFAQSTNDYIENSGQKDDEGNRLVANTDSNGRFHTDWLNMIYPRLKVAKDLLADDGAIFISIDQHEVDNLKKLCNEIFGESNFKSIISWQKRYTRSNNTVDFTTVIEYILVYSKSENFIVNLLPRTGEADERYSNPDNDPRGPWKGASLLNPATPSQRPNLCYEIVNPNTGEVSLPTTHAWRFSKEKFDQYQNEKRLYWGADGKSKLPSLKMYLKEARGLTPINYWSNDYAGNTDAGTYELTEIIGIKAFDFPKPSLLIKRVIEHATDKNSLILDFFSGSGTTAQAVLEKNAEDCGNRKYILVQIPESIAEKSDARKSGYSTISEIAKERIRRVGKKIIQEQSEETNLFENNEVIKRDLGFRVLKLDSSNMKEIYYKPSDVNNDIFAQTEDNIKEDRTDEDLLFQVMLEMAVPLSAKIRSEEICGKKVMIVDDDYLIACFDKDITNEVVTDIAKRKPQYFVMRDSSAMDDSVITNFETIFQTYSMDTVRKIL